jgi:hypothetical protein
VRRPRAAGAFASSVARLAVTKTIPVIDTASTFKG